jgi:hypothetical protein
MNAGLPTSQWQTLAAAIITSLAGCKMRLYKSPITWDPTNVLATYSAAECTYTGYAPVTCTPAIATNQPTGGQLIWFLQTVFQMSAAPGQDAYGWFITDTTGMILIAAGQFDAFFQFVNPGDGFALQTSFGIGNDQQVLQAFSTIGE